MQQPPPVYQPTTVVGTTMASIWRAQNPTWFAELDGLIARTPPVPTSNTTLAKAHVSLVVQFPHNETDLHMMPAAVFVSTAPETLNQPTCRLCGETDMTKMAAGASCGHVFCAECWRRQLSRVSACPTCNASTVFATKLQF